MSTLSTPIAFLVFNRPRTTARVWEAIRNARPQTLLVVADGPRADRPGEAELCAAVRAICEQVDWPCDVHRNYSNVNLGCKRRVSSGLDWVFDTVEEAIILEDDCLPHPSFFWYCQELLSYYRDDERVMLISGDNFQVGPPRTADSYYFSRYPHIWGWASWRRAWRHYDVNMKLWPTIRDGGWLADILGNPEDSKFWRAIFDRVANNEIDTWDYQVAFACWSQSAFSIVPHHNLVTNIGFAPDATHTQIVGASANLPASEMPFPLRHPQLVIRETMADRATADLFFRMPKLRQRIVARGKMFVRSFWPRKSRPAMSTKGAQ